jgi:hypothetical protein
MDTMLQFIFGFVIGGLVMTFTLCSLQISKGGTDDQA